MARIPKYPYRVVVTVDTGGRKDGRPVTRLEQHNYETLPGAMTYRLIALGKPRTRKVEVTLCLDESTPEHSTGE